MDDKSQSDMGDFDDRGVSVLGKVTEGEPKPASTNIPRVGDAMRRLRLKKNLSLAALAELSNVSSGMLSQIERDIANPSLRVLTQILDALGATMKHLFVEEPAPSAATYVEKEASFVRRRELHPMLEFGYLRKELLSPGIPLNMQMMNLLIPPGGSSGPAPLTYAAEKGGIVLDGEFVLTVGDEEATIRKGDSFAFDSTKPHSFINVSNVEAKVLWVIARVQINHHL